ncbi:MAG: universal stress protein [Bacteroidota bacterium]
MKTILVPTDFSDASLKAVSVAKKLASLDHGIIHFLHLMDIPIDWIHMNKGQEKLYPDISKKVSEANSMLDELVKDAESSDIEAHKHVHYNHQFSEITQYCKDISCDLIVMGSKGIHNTFDFLVGSVTQKVVRTASVPVVVVPSGAKTFNLQRIAFASDFQDEALVPYYQVLELAQDAAASVHLVYVNTPFDFINTPIMQTRMDAFDDESRDLKEQKTIYNYIHFEEGIAHFCKDHEIDLLVLITHGKKNLPRLLGGSFTESVISHSKIPVMSINLAP